MHTLEIICPAFREEQVIGLFHDRLASVLDTISDRYACRIIYILDPSPDRTEAILSAIAAADRRVEVLVMSRRFGHQAALIAGMDYCSGDAVIMLDSDLQHPPELIVELLTHWENGADIVQAIRREGGESSRLRRALSRGFYTIFLKIGVADLPEGAADYRLLSRRIVKIFSKQLCEHNPFLRGLVGWVGYKIAYVPFTPAKRERGSSKYGSSALFAFALNGICSFSKIPLRLCIAAGLLMAMLSVSGAVVQIAAYALGTTDVPGWASLFSAVSLIGGIQLFFLGVLGEFVGLIFDEVKDRPRYLLNKRHAKGATEVFNGVRSSDAELSSRPDSLLTFNIGRSVRERSTPQPGSANVYRNEFDALVTGRKRSLFESDMEAKSDMLRDAISGRRILVVGGGGSIGSATTEILLDYHPTAVHVVDHSENYLAELVRNLRGRPHGVGGVDFHTFPVDYGSPIMERLLRETQRYDVVLNFAALKHVRSEKDVHSTLQMLDTNVISHFRFKEWLERDGHGHIYFAVSTDKAANPTSVMGASKRLMEDVVFGVAARSARSTTSARFANVAFSNGSLLQSFLRRLERRQPLAVPRDTLRYFMSHQEAGELCALAAFGIPSQHIAFPKMNPQTHLQALDEIAARILRAVGFEPEFLEDEERARREVETFAKAGRWPVLLTPLDTSGEKPYEEFLGGGETEVDVGLRAISTLVHRSTGSWDSGLFERLAALINNPGATIDKASLVACLKQPMPNFCHVETGRDLDQRL